MELNAGLELYLINGGNHLEQHGLLSMLPIMDPKRFEQANNQQNLFFPSANH
jgi:hypothetical protein